MNAELNHGLRRVVRSTVNAELNHGLRRVVRSTVNAELKGDAKSPAPQKSLD